MARLDSKTDLQSCWIQSAVEQRLLDVSDAAQILVEAVRFNRSPWDVAEDLFASDQPRIKELETLLSQLDIKVPEKQPDEQLSQPDCEQTQAAGRSSKGRQRADGRNRPSGVQGLGSKALDDVEQMRPSGHQSRKHRTSAKSSPAYSADDPRPAPQNQFLTTNSAFSRYEVTEEVGRGGCGVVHKARDKQLGRDVVLKRILDDHVSNDDVVQRFLNEARITGQLEHPGIVPVHEIGQDDNGNPFFAMKEVRGVTLARRISDLHNGPDGTDQQLQTRKLLDRFLSVCQTMAFAHQAGVIHRDIKPANIMVGEFGETILLDWGLARRVKPQSIESAESMYATLRPGPINSGSLPGRSNSSSGKTFEHASIRDMTRQGTVLGTAAYMSPEQARGQNDLVNQTSDVFSLGVMLYEILSGESPFRSDTLRDTLSLVAQCKYRPVRELRSTIPRPLAAICEHAMQRDQRARYANAQELADELQNYLSGGPVAVYDEKPWEKFDRTANNHPAMFRTIFLFSLLIASGALIALGTIGHANRMEKLASQTAVQAKQKAESALVYEQLAHHRARTQLVASRRAADNWLLELSGDLQFYPGLDSIRASLIDKGVAHYKRLQESAIADWETTRDRQSSSMEIDHEEVSQLLSEWMFCTLRLADLVRLSGDSAQASLLYEDVVKRSSDTLNAGRLGPQPRSDIRVQQANAKIGLSLIESHDTLSQTSLQSTDPSQLLAGVILDLQGLINENPRQSDARNALVRACLVASRGVDQDQSDQGLVLLDQGLFNANILIQQEPNRRYQTLRCTVLEERARLLFRSAQYADAAEACRDLIRFYDILLQQSPERPDLIESRSVGYSLLGSSLLAQADALQAQNAYDRSATDLESAWELLYGEPFYRENRAVLAQNLSIALYAQGRLSASEESIRKAIAESRWLLQSDGIDVARVRRIATCYHLLVQVLQHRQYDTEETRREVRDILVNARVLIDHLDSEGQPTVDLRLEQCLIEANAAMQENDLRTVTIQLDQLRELVDQHTKIESSKSHWIKGNIELLQRELSGAYQRPNDQDILTHLSAATSGSAVHESERALAQLLSLLCFGSDPSLASDPVGALDVAFSWVQEYGGSAAAWHWLAIAYDLNGQYSMAESAARKAIGARGGETMPEDDLLLAIVAYHLNKSTADGLATSAIERATLSTYLQDHGRVLQQRLMDLHADD